METRNQNTTNQEETNGFSNTPITPENFNGNLKLFDSISLSTEYREEFKRQKCFLKGCKWSKDGCRIATCAADNVSRFFYCDDDYNITKYSSLSGLGIVYDYHWYPVFNEPCAIIASSLGPLHILNTITSKVISSYKMYNRFDEVNHAYSVALTPTGERIYGGSRDEIFVFDAARPGRDCMFVSIREHFNRSIISSMAVNPRRHSLLAIGTYNNRVGLFDDLNILCVLKGHKNGVTHVRFSPDGAVLYTGTRGCGDIFCWDMRQPGKILKTFKRRVGTQQKIYFDITEDGRYLVSGSTDGEVLTWDLSAENEEPSNVFTAHSDSVNGVSINPCNNKLLATASGQYHNGDIDSDSESEIFYKIDGKFENSLKLWKI